MSAHELDPETMARIEEIFVEESWRLDSWTRYPVSTARKIVTRFVREERARWQAEVERLRVDREALCSALDSTKAALRRVNEFDKQTRARAETAEREVERLRKALVLCANEIENRWPSDNAEEEEQTAFDPLRVALADARAALAEEGK